MTSSWRETCSQLISSLYTLTSQAQQLGSQHPQVEINMELDSQKLCQGPSMGGKRCFFSVAIILQVHRQEVRPQVDSGSPLRRKRRKEKTLQIRVAGAFWREAQSAESFQRQISRVSRWSSLPWGRKSCKSTCSYQSVQQFSWFMGPLTQ